METLILILFFFTWYVLFIALIKIGYDAGFLEPFSIFGNVYKRGLSEKDARMWFVIIAFAVVVLLLIIMYYYAS